MAEKRFDVGEFVETPCFDRAVFGAGVELVCTAAEDEACDGVAVLREYF